MLLYTSFADKLVELVEVDSHIGSTNPPVPHFFNFEHGCCFGTV